MQYLGVTYKMDNAPILDPDFIPFGRWMTEYKKGAAHPIAIAVERNDGLGHTPFPIWNQCIVPCPILTVAS